MYTVIIHNWLKLRITTWFSSLGNPVSKAKERLWRNVWSRGAKFLKAQSRPLPGPPQCVSKGPFLAGCCSAAVPRTRKQNIGWHLELHQCGIMNLTCFIHLEIQMPTLPLMMMVTRTFPNLGRWLFFSKPKGFSMEWWLSWVIYWWYIGG